jgi:hypothetical protein
MSELKKAEKNCGASKKKWKFYATLATLTLPAALTGCALITKPRPFTSPTSRLYAPDTLRIKKGATIQTPEGIYQAQANEVWHSDRRFRELEYDYLQTFRP